MLIKALLALSFVSALVACNTPEKVGSVTSSARATTCTQASLSLDDTAVIGSVDGQPLTFKDLGPEVANAERRALWDYCDAVQNVRSQAFDNYVVENLAKKAAEKSGKTIDEWMQAEVEKRVKQPTEEEIVAFYEARKRPGAPTLEEVRDQVVMILKREKSEPAVHEVIDGLKSGINIQNALPDVRSPARDVAVSAHTATKGGTAGAKVHVVEFADFQCPYCSQAANNVKTLQAKYGDRVQFAYRHFPLKSIHPDAQGAAEVGQCANAQGKFWELHDALYAAQEHLDTESLRARAKAVGLDEQKLDACLTSGRAAAEVNEDTADGMKLGVEGTPTFFVNGRLTQSTLEGLTAAIDAELSSSPK